MSIFDQVLLAAKRGLSREQIKSELMMVIDDCVDVVERDYQNEIIQHNISRLQGIAKERDLSKSERANLLELMLRFKP